MDDLNSLDQNYAYACINRVVYTKPVSKLTIIFSFFDFIT